MKKNNHINRLKSWFLKTKRDFPWRETQDPYAIWVSEVMLQQTRASVVVPYFLSWMRAFPDIESLAKAQEEQVIKQWEGLGYYSRARNLHHGAKYILEHFSGRLPEKEEDLLKIKGLGPYTVGAIRNFAFRQKAPAVDGNVLRVISRLFAIQEDITQLKEQRKIRELVINLLPEEEPWVISEALIELGATLCGKKPVCRECPLKSSCKGYLQGIAENLPFKTGKIPIEKLERKAHIIVSGEMVLLKKGKKGEIMADLYEFPIEKPAGMKLAFKENLGTLKYSFTRYRVNLEIEVWQADELLETTGFEWVNITDLLGLPFSSGHRRALHLFLKKEDLLIR